MWPFFVGAILLLVPAIVFIIGFQTADEIFQYVTRQPAEDFFNNRTRVRTFF